MFSGKMDSLVLPVYVNRFSNIYYPRLRVFKISIPRDEMVNFILQRGLQASRSRVVYFRHNDINHLEELLEEQVKQDKKVNIFIIIISVYFYYCLFGALLVLSYIFSWPHENFL